MNPLARAPRYAVLPARAGMIPVLLLAPVIILGAPRASGDDPKAGHELMARIECSPRERG